MDRLSLEQAVWLLAAVPVACFDFEGASRCYDGHACASNASDASADASGDASADAGARDAASTDAAPSLCLGPGVLLCDGFESPLLSAVWESVAIPGESRVAIDHARAFRGAASLHVRTGSIAVGEDARALIKEHTTEQPTPESDHYVRVFVYEPSSTLVPNFSRIVSLVETLAPYQSIELGTTSGTLTISDELMPQHQFSTTLLPMDRWVCLELGVIRGNPGVIHVWLDGVEVSDFPLTEDTEFSPPFGEIVFGLDYYHVTAGQSMTEAWLDEIAIDRARIGCDR
jgi:hypothetical protein